MNKVIGRKIYIYWGDRVLGIEQLLVDPNDFGFKLPKKGKNDIFPNTVTKGGVLVVDIYECMGEKIEGEKKLSYDHPSLSSDISDFLTHRECWHTEEEMLGIIETEE